MNSTSLTNQVPVAITNAQVQQGVLSQVLSSGSTAGVAASTSNWQYQQAYQQGPVGSAMWTPPLIVHDNLPIVVLIPEEKLLFFQRSPSQDFLYYSQRTGRFYRYSVQYVNGLLSQGIISTSADTTTSHKWMEVRVDEHYNILSETEYVLEAPKVELQYADPDYKGLEKLNAFEKQLGNKKIESQEDDIEEAKPEEDDYIPDRVNGADHYSP